MISDGEEPNERKRQIDLGAFVDKSRCKYEMFLHTIDIWSERKKKKSTKLNRKSVWGW
jgi:hypothetical protein